MKDRLVAKHIGSKQAMVIIDEFLGTKSPPANAAMSEPGRSLALTLYELLKEMPELQLSALVNDLEGIDFKPGSNKELLQRAKRIVYWILQVDSGEDTHGPMAAWKMWPHVINPKERKMATTKKQATKKKSKSKRVERSASKKKTSKKKVSKKKGTTKKVSKKKVTMKKAAATGKKGKPAGTKLLTPVKKEGKRGAVLAKFTLKTAKTPDKAAEELGTSRANIMSHLHDLNKYHGIGYELDGDGPVNIHLPKGCKSPWA